MTGQRFAASFIVVALFVQASPARADSPAQRVVQTTDIGGWFQPLPFHRILDVSTAAGYSNLPGQCIEVSPFWFVSAQFCGGLFLFLAGADYHVDLRLPLFHYSLIHDDLLANKTHRMHGWEYGFGPLIGARWAQSFSLFDTTPTINSTALDVGLSFEAVYWVTRYFGWKTQVDAGVGIGLAGQNAEGFGSNQSAIFEIKTGPAF